MSVTTGKSEKGDKVDILVVDDKKNNLTVWEAVLDLPNYNLVQAQSGPEAISLLSKYDFACVLLDVQMPGMDGFETARRMREIPDAKEIPIIFVTAIYDEDFYISRAYELGAVDYIFKPFDPVIIRSKIGVFVDLFRKTKLLLQQSELLRKQELESARDESRQREIAIHRKYWELIENIEHCIIWSVDPKTLECTFVSPHAARMTGDNRNAWFETPRFWEKHILPEERSTFLVALSLAQQGKEANLEHRFVGSKGEIFWFNTSIRLVKTDTQNDEILGLSVDISEAKQTTEALRKSEEKFRTLTETMPQLVWTTDNEGRPRYLNKRWIDYTGFQLPDAEWSWSDVIHADDLETTEKMWAQSLKSGKNFEMEFRMKRQDGRYRWQLVRARPQKDQMERVVQWLGTCTDIEDQKRTEIAQRYLAESSAILASSLDYEDSLRKIADLAVLQFADGCTVHLFDGSNRVRLIAFGSSDKVRLNEIREALRENPILMSHRHGVAKVLRTGQPEILAVGPDWLKADRRNPKFIELVESLKMKSCLIVPLAARGKTIGTISISSTVVNFSAQDLAVMEELGRCAGLAIDNAQLYQSADNAIHARDEFLSIASHELKTPLTPLKLQLQILKRLASKGELLKLSPEKIEKMLERSDRQLNRINQLIEDLLNVSKINLGQTTLEFKETGLSEIIGDVVEQFKDQLAAAGSRVEMKVAADIRGKWDARALEQVVVNLLTNAIKYGNKRPIWISARAEGGNAVLEIKDEGIGIAQADQKKIFALFARAVPASNYGGLGLGLYIVRKIVEQHGGNISVKSKVGQGATFIVTLPLHAPMTAID